MTKGSRELFTFTHPASVADWSAIDDVVMGGLSRSHLAHDPAGHAVFGGIVSLENNGGFASVRSNPADLSAPGAVACQLVVRGDGKQYKLSLRTDERFDGVSYQHAFRPKAGEWVALELPLAAFVPTHRGKVLTDVPALNPARLCQAGLLIAGRQAGSFLLAIRAIRLLL
ncbi:MAG: CIA30 family protein [Methylococcaceae bacterium]|nr:CIA30 family protein [Methylococcaceae bacterium]